VEGPIALPGALCMVMKGDLELQRENSSTEAPSKVGGHPHARCARGILTPSGTEGSKLCPIAPHMQGVPMVKVVQVADGIPRCPVPLHRE